MAFLKKSNNYKSTLAADVTVGATTIVVSSVANLPATFDYLLTIWNEGLYADPSDDGGVEVVKVTSRSGTTLTVTRAQDDTSASTHTSGDRIALLFVKAHSDEWEDAIDLNTDHRSTGGNHPDVTIGGDTNYLDVSSGGVVTMAGTAKRELTLRADLDFTTVTAQGKPSQVIIGLFHGYSMPIYNNDNEELFFNENVPGRWDGASDITFQVLCCLALAETAGETFKFQFSWNQVGEADVVPVATHDTTDEITVVDGTQYATYMLEFTIDYNVDVGDVILSHDDLTGRLRRVASTGDEVDGEIIVLDWHTHYTVNKMFKVPE